MGLWESKEVYLVGEVDYRVLAFDRPWITPTNLGLRHATPVDEKDLPKTALTSPDKKDTLMNLMQYTELNRGPIWFQADNASILPRDPLMHPPISDTDAKTENQRLCTRVIIRTKRYTVSKRYAAADCHILNIQIGPEHPQFGYARK